MWFARIYSWFSFFDFLLAVFAICLPCAVNTLARTSQHYRCGKWAEAYTRLVKLGRECKITFGGAKLLILKYVNRMERCANSLPLRSGILPRYKFTFEQKLCVDFKYMLVFFGRRGRNNPFSTSQRWVWCCERVFIHGKVRFWSSLLLLSFVSKAYIYIVYSERLLPHRSWNSQFALSK